MKKLICGILVVFFLLSSACAQEQTFESVLAEANALHKAQTEMVPEENIRDFIPTLPATELGFTEEELVSLTKGIGRNFNGEKRITLSQAKHDVDLLFRVFRYCYGAYEYFGGEEVFEEARASVLNDLGALGNAFIARDMAAVLRKNLAFIQDGHFYINTSPIPEMQSYFSTEELVFELDKGGYFSQVDGEKQYLLSVDGNTEIEGYMKLSIGPDGGLIYRLGMLDDANVRNKIINAAFENTAVTLTLQQYSPDTDYDSDIPYSENWDGAVPVVAYRDCFQNDSFENFLSSAKRLRREPITIIDLRGNKGGIPDVVKAWLNAYDSEGIAKNCYGVGHIYLTTRATCYLMASYLKYNPILSQSPKLNYNSYMEWYQRGFNKYDLTENDAGLRFFDAEGLLFVLMDSRTMSGGEWLLAALRTRENTVFVGTNSTGMLLGGGGEQIVLPNSSIYFSFGYSLLLSYDERVFQEGRGFLPDIWVNGDALERVKALIGYYQVA